MAKESPLAQLSKKPLGVQLAVLGAVLAVLGFGYWQFFYSGLDEEKSAAQSRKRSVSKKVDELRADKKDLEQLRRERAERKLKIEKGILKLPAKAELPAFLKQLQNQAGAAGVKLKKYAQQAEIVVEDFLKVPYKIEATGTFYQLARYFWLLWEYSKSDSGLIITIENLSLGDATVSPDGILLTAEFTASTFRQSEASDAAAQAAAAAQAEAGAAAGAPKTATDKQKVEAAKNQREGAADKASAAGAEK